MAAFSIWFHRIVVRINIYLDRKTHLPRGQDLQSEGWAPGALSNGTNEPVGQSLQVVPTWPTSSE